LFRAGRASGEAALADEPGGLSLARFAEERSILRRALPEHLAPLDGLEGRAALVEGITQVSVRSCLRALDPGEVAAIEFDGLEDLVRPDRLEEIRGRLRGLVSLVIREAERLASLFDVFRVLSDEVRALAIEWRGAGVFRAEVELLPEQRLADQLKECLRVPLAVTCERQGGEMVRRVRFLPLDGLGYQDLAEVDVLVSRNGRWMPAAAASPGALLPFWDLRARRGAAGSPESPAAASSPLERLLGGEVEESEADLAVLRSWTTLGATSG
ncbi:MAG TPA: hypothetical protein VEJ89_09875, partial [Myxococcaceae bacterium]|nr:hypothetical protein [Myxococcaceae bacterium]